MPNKGIVIEFLVTKYLLIDIDNKQKIYAYQRGKMKYFSYQKNILNSNEYGKIKIGDVVSYKIKNNNFYIDKILPRKNELKRPNIANIDQVFLVFSLIQPQLNFKLLDKFLIVLHKFRLNIILIFTKLDLVAKEQFKILKTKLAYYEKFYFTFYVNSKQKNSLEPLYSLLKEKITILAGQTGVGKSTLLSTLISLNLKTQEISLSLNRGKHTTKNSKLYFFHNGYIADTPGFSKLDVSNIAAEEIKNFYHDFQIFAKQCFFGHSCVHIKEKNCKIKEAYQKGLILEIRYKNYVSLFKQLQKNSTK
ncbi:MAG: ribosome small subunit-dependent GTPase A [Vigna little leaf phytoplasma]|nr:ribosome small subunit-dependent GTPase A [Vigna little leaf phytoplasma]